MHKLRKLIALLGVVAISSTLVVSTASAEWYTPYIENLDGVGVDWADSVGDNTTRCEWATAVVAWNGLTASMPSEPTFADVPADHPCFEAIEIAAANMVVSGYSGDKAGYFGPGDLVTREQAMKMTVEGADLPLIEVSEYDFYPDYADISDWAKDAGYPETAYYWTIFVGDSDTGMLRPQDHINHAEAAKVITTEPVLNEDYLLVEDDVITATGDLDVEISDDTPEGATLPSGATSVPMATWDFTAGSDDAVITSVKVHRFGVSSLPSGHQVYLYNGSERLTSGKSINSSTNLATFNNLNIEVPEGETVSLTLRMDVGTVTTTGEIGFEIEEVTAGAGEVTLHDTKGDMFGLSTTPAGTVTIQKNGTVTDATVGEKGFTFAKFKVSAATEDAQIEEIGLYVGGGSIATDDLENFHLYVSGETTAIAEVEMVNTQDVVTFVLDTPYDLSKGDTRSFWATADLNTGRTGDTLFAYIDETTDVLAIGGTYGYGMTVDATAYDGSVCTVATPTECNAMTLEGGDITLAGNTLSNRNIAVNGEDVVILSFTITALTDVTFDNFGMHLMATEDAADATAGLLSDATGTPANFTDIKINEVDGSHEWGPVDADALTTVLGNTTAITEGADNTGYYLFTDDLYMEAGEVREFELTVDVANEPALGEETITAAIDIDATYPRMKDVNNKVLTNADSLVPTSDYIGDAFTIKSNNLTVVRSSAVGSTNQVRGTDDAELLALSVGAGDANDTKVTQIKLTGYVDENVAADGYTAGIDNSVAFNEIVLGMNLYEGSVAEENKLNASAKAADPTSGEVVFDNLEWEIPAGDSAVLIITGNLSNNSAYDQDEIKLDIADVSADLVAEDVEGNSITCSSPDLPNGGLTDDATTYTQITIFGGGSLALDTRPNTHPSEIVVADATGAEFTELKLTAADESFVVQKLALRNTYGTTPGDYNDNFSAVQVRYFTDAEQTVEETKTCSQSTKLGYYVCTGMNMYVPDPDISGAPDYALLTVQTNLKSSGNIKASGGLGDQPMLSFALSDDFLAVGEDSGRQVKGVGNGNDGLLLTDSVAASYVNTVAYELDMAANATATDTILIVDEANALPSAAINPGSLACVDLDTSGDCTGAGEEIMYVYATDVCTGVNTPKAGCVDGTQHAWTVKRGVNQTTAIAITDNDDLVYLDAANVNAANLMQVQGADIDMEASTDTRTAASTKVNDPILTFTVTSEGPDTVTLDALTVNLSINEDWLGLTPGTAYLKEGSTTVATATVGGGAGAVINMPGAVTTHTASIDFSSPAGVYPVIEINGSKTFTVEFDTLTTVDNAQSDETESLNAFINKGNITTTGDVLWSDSEDQMDFFGIGATDQVSTVSIY